MDFKGFDKIIRLDKCGMRITQKIHGSNAQVVIFKNDQGELDLITGSRNRWVVPGDDNYGFAAYVYANKVSFIEKLGEGTHFGEWAGPGINSGEGLTEKTLALFGTGYSPDELPPGVCVVPTLYRGKIDSSQIELAMARLKKFGSQLVEGYMCPEGIVVEFNGVKMKKVFDAEETQWKKAEKTTQARSPGVDYSYLCHPIRLEKLLSKDERLLAQYPKSIGNICKEYVADLIEEGQIPGDKDEVASIRKKATGFIFKFIRTTIDAMEISG